MKTKIPPQAIDLEKAVLGAVLIDKEALETVTEILRPEMFYQTSHQMIYEAMIRLNTKSQPIDMLTVIEELRKGNELDQIGGGYYLTALTNAVVSSAHVKAHSRKLVEYYLLRSLIKIGADLYTKGYDAASDPFELIETAEKTIHDITQNLTSKDFITIDDTMFEIVKELEEKRNREHWLTGVATGFPTLDRATCGWQPTDFMILAARPKCGKTAFALNLALNAALNGEGVGFFSLEMSAAQLVKRLLSNKASMYLQSLRDANLDEAQMMCLYQNGIQKLSGIPFYIDDTASLSVSEFKSKARRMVKKYGLKFLVLDYLQLMQPEKGKKNQNREQEVSTMARQLKITAKELGVPILSMSQLNREADGQMPQLSNLRESGSLEQDADMVMFLHRPDAEDKKKIIFKIAAYRNGDLIDIEFDFNGAYQRFEEKGVPAKLIPIQKAEEETFRRKRNVLPPTGTDDEDLF